MNFLEDPKYKSIRVVLVIIIIASAGWFVVSNMNQSGGQTGSVFDDDGGLIQEEVEEAIVYYNDTEQRWIGSCNGSNVPSGVDINDWVGPTVTIVNAAETFSSEISVEDANTNAKDDAKMRATEEALAGCHQVYRCREDQTAVASCPAGTASKLNGEIFLGTILDITYGRDGDNYTVSVVKPGYSALNQNASATSDISVEDACAKLMESAQQKADDLAETNCEPI